MSGVIDKKARMGQGKGPDVDLIVSGTPTYATYETVDGFPAIYDHTLELFCYARVTDGAYESTGVPVTAAPPPGVAPHAKESPEVRAAKVTQRQSEMDRRSPASIEKE